MEKPVKINYAYFGGGCFWCIEAIFQKIKGVTDVKPGYTGGSKANPSYDEVCTGTSGHAEVIQLSFDESTIKYEDLLYIFFRTHNPTTLNSQGGDKGTQYRSCVFTSSKKQKKAENKKNASLFLVF